MNSPAPFKPEGNNPFRPTIGKTPPFVAGRGEELAQFDRYTRMLQEEGEGEVIIMFAPRGNGKTVLLHRLEEQCAAAGMTVVRAQPARDGCLALADLQELLLPDTAPDTSQLSIGGGVNLGAAAFDIQWTAKGAKKSGQFKTHLKQACDTAPRVLLIDEAHQWHGGDRPELIGMCQPIIDRHPFLVVIAGTPGLMSVIEQDASGIDRAPKICPGLLDMDSAMDAVRVPLDRGGITIADNAIRAVAADAQCYPYFLQVWGAALWDYAARHGLQHLTDEHARAAKAAVGQTRDGFYNRRYEEIRKHTDLSIAATAVADAFNGGGQYDQGGIAAVIALALRPRIADEDEREERAEVMLDRLIELGFIWKAARVREVQAGIPSLMTYVAQNRDERQPELPAADLRRIAQDAAARLQRRANIA